MPQVCQAWMGCWMTWSGLKTRYGHVYGPSFLLLLVKRLHGMFVMICVPMSCCRNDMLQPV